IPESGDLDGEYRDAVAFLQPDEEGEILERKDVNSNIWYRVKAYSTQAAREVEGWTPLGRHQMSEMESEISSYVSGTEFLEMFVSDTGEITIPSETAHLVRGNERETASRLAVPGHVAPSCPVWLAYVGGRLYLREKASGALEVGEVAVLCADTLKYIKTLNLSHLPVPGFPGAEKTSSVHAGGGGDREMKAWEAANAGGTGDRRGSRSGHSGRLNFREIDFSDASLGAAVMECSSNATLSGGILQHNLLLPNPRDRAHYPPLHQESEEDIRRRQTEGYTAAVSTAFSFSSDDAHRVVVVGLGRPRRLTQAGVELHNQNLLDFNVAYVMSSLLVEYSMDGATYCRLGSVDIFPDSQAGSMVTVECAAGEMVTAMFVRCSLAPPVATSPSPTPPMCMLSRVLALGPEETEMEKAALKPFPAMTTDSRHLVFVHSSPSLQDDFTFGRGSSKGDDLLPQLEVYFVDPENPVTVVKECKLGWGTEESSWDHIALCTNGERLMLLGPPDGSTPTRTPATEEVPLRCQVVIMKEGENLEKMDDLTYPVKKGGQPSGSPICGAPCGFVYDKRNNMIWGWDSIDHKLLRWRNKGLAPVFSPPMPSQPAIHPPTDQETWTIWAIEMLSSASPINRIWALNRLSLRFNMPNKLVGALLMCNLERMGEAFGPPEETVAEARVGCELEASSGGMEDGNFSRLLVRGEDLCMKEAGINVLLMDEDLIKAKEDSVCFATQRSRHDASQLAVFIKSLDLGETVMVAVQDDCAGHLTNMAKRALVSLGASWENVNSLAARKHCSFAMIGRKGAQPGTVPQVLKMPSKGHATVRQRLPAAKVHMCVDVSKEALHSLINLILQHEHLIKDKSTPGQVEGTLIQGEIDEVILLSTLNVLTTQVFQLLRGATAAQVVPLFSGDHLQRMLPLLLRMVDQDVRVTSQFFAKSLSRASLRLFSAAMDIFYPTCVERCLLLDLKVNEYLSCKQVSQGKKAVLEMLLRRLSNHSELAEVFFIAYPSVVEGTGMQCQLAAGGVTSGGMAGSLREPGFVPGGTRVRFADGVVAGSVGPGVATRVRFEHGGSTLRCTQTKKPMAPLDMVKTLLAITFEEGRNHLLRLERAYAACSTSTSTSPQTFRRSGVSFAAIEMVGRLCNHLISRSASLIIHGTESQAESLNSSGDSPSSSVNTANLDATPPSALSSKGGGAGAPAPLESHRDGAAVLQDLCIYMGKTCSSLCDLAIQTDQNIRNSVAQAARVGWRNTAENGRDGEPPLANEIDLMLEESALGALLPAIVAPITLLVKKYGSKMKPELLVDGVTGMMGGVTRVLNRVSVTQLTGGNSTKVATSEEANQESWEREECIHWLVSLDRQLGGFGAAVASALVTSVPWADKTEDDSAQWLEDELLAGVRYTDPTLGSCTSPVTSPMMSSVATPVPPPNLTSEGGLDGVDAIKAGMSTLAIGTNGIKPGQEGGGRSDRLASLKGRQDMGGLSVSMVGGVGTEAESRRQREQEQRELKMLWQLLDKGSGGAESLGAKLIEGMRPKVQRDQGRVEDINCAVYATCAALIHIRGLGGDAYDFATGKVEEPSEALLKTWNFGQNMRPYFHIGDLKLARKREIQQQEPTRRGSGSISLGNSEADGQLPVVPPLTRSPSLFEGIQEEAIHEVSMNVIERCAFLLERPPRAKDMLDRPTRANSNPREKAKRVSQWISSSELSRVSEPVKNTQSEAMNKLIQDQNRRKRRQKEAQSEGERIMNFVQSTTPASELKWVRNQRNKRARLRAKGLDLTCRILRTAGTPPSKGWVLASLASAVRCCKKKDRPGAHVHYSSCVEGCDSESQAALTESFQSLLCDCLG
ncbi:unnamed protein product, partial [Discosporangium mesarthrocarpum]